MRLHCLRLSLIILFLTFTFGKNLFATFTTTELDWFNDLEKIDRKPTGIDSPIVFAPHNKEEIKMLDQILGEVESSLEENLFPNECQMIIDESIKNTQ